MIRMHYMPTPREVAQDITRQIFELADHATHPLRIALSGGSTPASLFEYWCEIPEELLRRQLHFWWVDERMVHESSKDSNYGNASRQFFAQVDYPSSWLHPIRYDGTTTADVAQSYAAEFEGVDVVILGMGADGHTSSLFPGQDLFDMESPYIASIHPDNGIERVALSYLGILATPKVFFHILGRDKKDRLAEIIALSRKSQEESKKLPAAYVLHAAREVDLFTDIDGIVELI